MSKNSEGSRRGFLQDTAKVAAGASLLAGLNPVRAAHVSADETIRIGLIGCGGRGRGAADQAMNMRHGRAEPRSSAVRIRGRSQPSW